MKNIILLFAIVVFSIVLTRAQDIEEIQAINNKSKVQYVKPETLDGLMNALRPYESSHSPAKDSILLETYRSISDAYMANNHFKQAYQVFSKYLAWKEQMLSADKTSAISHALNSVSTLQNTDASKQTELQSQLDQLNEDNESLASKRSSFKRNFSLGLLILSAIFAVMLVSSWIRMFSLRAKLRQSQDRMKNIHRFAVVGNSANGLRSSSRSALTTIGNQTKELKQDVEKTEKSFAPAKQVLQIIPEIEKKINDLVNKIQ